MKPQLEVLEIVTNGITVHVEIDYNKETLSLVERNEDNRLEPKWTPKQWWFHNRTIEYTRTWVDICNAMKCAIGQANERLEERLKEKEEEKTKLMIEANKKLRKE
jgi:hypothetical protein